MVTMLYGRQGAFSVGTAGHAHSLQLRRRFMPARTSSACFGLIVGNRGFFPDILASEGYEVLTKLLKGWGYDVVVLSTNDTKFGSVEEVRRTLQKEPREDRRRDRDIAELRR